MNVRNQWEYIIGFELGWKNPWGLSRQTVDWEGGGQLIYQKKAIDLYVDIEEICKIC